MNDDLNIILENVRINTVYNCKNIIINNTEYILIPFFNDKELINLGSPKKCPNKILILNRK